MDGSASRSASVVGNALNFSNIGVSGGVAFSDSPTVTITPRQGEDIARQLHDPLPVSAVADLITAGCPIDQTIQLLVQGINDVRGPNLRYDMFRPGTAEWREVIALIKKFADEGTFIIDRFRWNDPYNDYAFAVTGGIAAAEKRLDLGGFLLLTFVTGVGGGTLRDLILVRGLVFWAAEPIYIALCAVAAVLTFYTAHLLPRLRATLLWSDAVGLAVFAVIGAGIARQQDARPLTAVLMGVLTGTGGGVVREVIRNELPLILHRDIYMTAALASSAALVGLDVLGTPAWLALRAGASVTFLVRAVGILGNVHLPRFGHSRDTERGASESLEDTHARANEHS